MAFGGKFHCFSKVTKVSLAGVIGAASGFLAWNSSCKSSLNADVDGSNNDITILDILPADCITVSHNDEKAADSKSFSDTLPTSPGCIKTDQSKCTTINLKYAAIAPKLYSIIHQMKEVCGSPGISYAISRNGELVMQGGIGLADVENYVPCTSETVLRIASISKSVTSVAVGKLLQEGLINLNEPIQTYVPSFPLKKFDDEDVTVTVKEVLTHTSGIRGYFDYKERVKGKEPIDDKAKRKHEVEVKKYGEDCKNSDENYIKEHYDSVEEGLNLFRDDPLIYKPGTDYEYSSLAYSLISRMIEKVSGKDYVTYMNKICNDIGMRSTKVDLNDPIIFQRARNYRRADGGTLKNVSYVDNSYKWSGGGFLSNVQDLVKLGNMMLHSSLSDGGYLKKSTVATLWHPEPITIGKCSKKNVGNGYALGWIIKPKVGDDKSAVYHSGGAVGVSSVLVMVPDEDSSNTSKDHPQGIVVALIVNMQSVRLTETALDISRCLHEYGQQP